MKGKMRVKQKIIETLDKIEKEENIKILLAVESGSRAWGFASPDSDYDVRFIYIRKLEDYLRLNPIRDVIELPIDEELDVNGWDLQKTLRLLYKSNPTLFEWLTSPIVYKETAFASKLKKLMGTYFCAKKSLYHYMNMAEGNYREYLRGEKVRAKKYFYVLRPVLACRWILGKGTPPPMLFEELMEAELPEELQEDVQKLLELKRNSPEIKEIKRMDKVNLYLDQEIAKIKEEIKLLENEKNLGWEELNQLFLNEVKGDDLWEE